MGDIIAITERLILRLMDEGDKENIFKLAMESPLLSNLPRDESYMDLYRKASWEEVSTPNTFNVLMFLKEDNSFVGKVCMQFIDKPLPELGIDILSSFRNKGYGPEAIIAFCNWYSENKGLPKVKVRISKENSHSVYVFEKLGAEFQDSTSYISENSIDMIRQMLPDADLSELSKNSVREYILHLPLR